MKVVITVEAPVIGVLGITGLPDGASVRFAVQGNPELVANEITARVIKTGEIKSYKVTDNPKSLRFRLRRWKNAAEFAKYQENDWLQCSSCSVIGNVPDEYRHEKRHSPAHILPCEALEPGFYRSMTPVVCMRCQGFFSVGGKYTATSCPDCEQRILERI